MIDTEVESAAAMIEQTIRFASSYMVFHRAYLNSWKMAGSVSFADAEETVNKN